MSELNEVWRTGRHCPHSVGPASLTLGGKVQYELTLIIRLWDSSVKRLSERSKD